MPELTEKEYRQALRQLEYAILLPLQRQLVGELIADPAQVKVRILDQPGPPLLEDVGDMLIASIRLHLTGREAGEFRYPADWWQAFKARFFPRWARRRWPVQYKVVKLAEIYPDVALPNERRLVVNTNL